MNIFRGELDQRRVRKRHPSRNASSRWRLLFPRLLQHLYMLSATSTQIPAHVAPTQAIRVATSEERSKASVETTSPRTTARSGAQSPTSALVQGTTSAFLHPKSSSKNLRNSRRPWDHQSVQTQLHAPRNVSPHVAKGQRRDSEANLETCGTPHVVGDFVGDQVCFGRCDVGRGVGNGSFGTVSDV